MIITTLIIKDSLLLDQIQKQINSLFNKNNLDYKIETTLPKNSIKENNYLYFIEINNKKDIENTKIIPSKKSLIIFVSGNNNLVFDTLFLQPFYFIRVDYLNKDLIAFNQLLINYIRKHWLQLKIKTSKYELTLNVNSIIYIESYGHHIHIHTIIGEYKVRMSIKEIINRLSKYQIIRIHKSYLVNMNYINYMNSNKIILKDYLSSYCNIELPIGRAYKDLSEKEYKAFKNQ